jgi:hypothetical protein
LSCGPLFSLIPHILGSVFNKHLLDISDLSGNMLGAEVLT